MGDSLNDAPLEKLTGTLQFNTTQFSAFFLSCNAYHRQPSVSFLDWLLVLSWAEERILAALKAHLLFENVSNRVVSYHNFSRGKTVGFFGP